MEWLLIGNIEIGESRYYLENYVVTNVIVLPSESRRGYIPLARYVRYGKITLRRFDGRRDGYVCV